MSGTVGVFDLRMAKDATLLMLSLSFKFSRTAFNFWVTLSPSLCQNNQISVSSVTVWFDCVYVSLDLFNGMLTRVNTK